MRELFRIKDSLANKISYYHLMLLMASLPFDRFYSHIILASFAAHTLIQLRKGTVKPVLTLRNAVLQSVFFVTLLSTIYTINRHEAFTEWGKQITILLIPIIFCLTALDVKKYRSKLLLAFSLVCTLIIIYLYANALLIIRHYQLPLSVIFSPAFTNHNFAAPINMHATFFSMQVAIALICILSALIKERVNKYRLLYTFCVLVLFGGLIQLCSKSVFIALFFIINLAVPFFLLQGKKRVRLMLGALTLSALVIISIFSVSTLRVRYITDLKDDLSLKIPYQVVDSRLDRWSTSIELISKSPVIGYGAGSEIGLLHDRFYEKKYYSSFINRLNTHSEYLSFLLKSGIIGLLIYLGTLAFGFKLSFKNKDLLFLTFMLLIAIVSFSENLLDVDKGIIFYAFFFSFFAYSSGGEKHAAKF
jgi:O-antigen ligase